MRHLGLYFFFFFVSCFLCAFSWRSNLFYTVQVSSFLACFLAQKDVENSDWRGLLVMLLASYTHEVIAGLAHGAVMLASSSAYVLFPRILPNHHNASIGRRLVNYALIGWCSWCFTCLISSGSLEKNHIGVLVSNAVWGLILFSLFIKVFEKTDNA